MHVPPPLISQGDWGTQFGMLIQYMKEKRPEGLGTEGGSEEDVADLQVRGGGSACAACRCCVTLNGCKASMEAGRRVWGVSRCGLCSRQSACSRRSQRRGS